MGRIAAIPCQAEFQVTKSPGLDLYCGCSIAACRALMEREHYQFVTVDQCGANAFFIDSATFPVGFADDLQGVGFRSNRSHVRAYGADRGK